MKVCCPSHRPNVQATSRNGPLRTNFDMRIRLISERQVELRGQLEARIFMMGREPQFKLPFSWTGARKRLASLHDSDAREE